MDAEESVGLVDGALAGDRLALTRLVAALTPVVQARVARTLLSRRWGRGGRDIRHEVEDLAQDVFLSLFANQARVLRSWQAERGLSLENFVGLVSERYVVSFLRSGRRNPWKEELASGDELDVRVDEPSPDRVAAGRQQLRLLVDGLRDHLSPLGFHLFQLLFVQELSLPETMAASGLSADAVYAWRSRLRRLARELMSDLSGTAPPKRTSRKGGRG
jgi:RNA polymerase sigma-70 factor (ECF subfamily)